MSCLLLILFICQYSQAYPDLTYPELSYPDQAYFDLTHPDQAYPDQTYPDPAIIGGRDAWGKQHGFMVSIFRCSGSGCVGEEMCEFFLCGGILIHPQWVITAAHCHTSGLPPTFYQVVVHDYDITEEDESPKEFRTEITEFIQHEEFVYTDSVIKNDIALIKLKEQVPDNKVECLKMNENDQQINIMNCRLYGWGQFQKNPPPNHCKNHKTLEFIELGQIDSDICQDDYEDKGWEIYESNICAGVVNEQGNAAAGSGACFGDSGGGLHCENKDTQGWELVGLTSFGFDICGEENRPSVFTRITSFTQWINNNCQNCAGYNRNHCFQTTTDPETTTPSTSTAEGCHGGDSCCSDESQCGVGEGDCVSEDECEDHLVCGDCMGSSHAALCCQYSDMAGCFLYHHMENGDWDCPGDDLDHGNYVDQGHVCVLRCRWGINDGYGGVISCLGHGVWDDDDLVGCEWGLDN